MHRDTTQRCWELFLSLNSPFLMPPDIHIGPCPTFCPPFHEACMDLAQAAGFSSSGQSNCACCASTLPHSNVQSDAASCEELQIAFTQSKVQPAWRALDLREKFSC